MKRLLTSSVVLQTFFLLLGASFSTAGADGMSELPPGKEPLRAELHISNQSTGQGGHFVSGSAGETIRFSLRVKNNVKQTVDVNVQLVAGVPGCMIQENRTVTLSKGKQAKEIVIGEVPADQAGLLTIDVTATSSQGVMVTDHAELSFNAASAPAVEKEGGFGIWHRLFLRVLTKTLLAGLESDDSSVTVKANLSEIKALYR